MSRFQLPKNTAAILSGDTAITSAPTFPYFHNPSLSTFTGDQWLVSLVEFLNDNLIFIDINQGICMIIFTDER